MSLSDLAALGSFISGLAVLASLGFLYFQMRQVAEQVRQADRNQRAANVLQTIRFSNAFNVGLMQPELSRIQLKLVRGDTDLTEVETMQALNLVCSYVSNAL